MPCYGHVDTREHVLCPGDDHGGLGDRYRSKHLATFLLPHVDSQEQARVNPCVETSQAFIKVRLAYLRIHSGNVLNKHAEVDTVQTLDRIVEDSVEDVVNGSSKLVASDVTDVR